MSKAAGAHCDGDASSSSSADEGDNNKSFVTKVKSHVTGLLPSKLSTWLGGKSRQRDEDNDDEEAYALQPPSKRVKTHNLDFDMSSITALHTQLQNPFSQEFREPIAGSSASSSANNTRKLVLPPSSLFSQNHVEHTNGVDSDSGESTSGYSSMPHISGSKEQVSELPGSSNAQVNHNNNNSTVMNKSIFNTSIPLERSLFGEHLTSPKQSSNSSLSSRRPSFNASSFGAPNFVDKTLSTRRIFNSPFYSGRITYGGASAYNRSLLNASADRNTPQSSPSVQPKLVNDNKGAALSKTAKRILDTLEQYTSPVQDVRRIPTERRPQRMENSLIGKYVGANQYMVRDSPKQASNMELHVPTTSDLLKMKQKERLQDSTSSMRAITTHTASSLNAEEYSIGNSEERQSGGKSTNKIKTKVASVRQKAAVDDDVAPVVKLPDVQLPISTLPTFNFSIPLGQFDKPKTVVTKNHTDSTAVEKPVNFGANLTDSKKPSNTLIKLPESPAVNFKNPEEKSAFASPVPKSTPKMSALPKLPTVLQETKQLVKNTKSPTKIEFRFSKPLVIAENDFKSIKAINNFKFSLPVVKKAVKNGLPPGKKVAVVSDVTLPKKGFGDMFKVGTDKWECTVCLVRNIATANTCISCTTPKAIAKPTVNGSAKTPPLTTTTSSWGDKFKAPANSWTCSECMITNDAAKEKCAACETPKQKLPTQTPAKVTGFDGFKKKADEWECPSCLIKNANAKEKCVCCETPKPGATKPTTETKMPAIASTWGDKFKAPSTTWECSMCMIRNSVNKEKCAACENPRPASVSAPTGGDGLKKANEWECTSCMVRNPSTKEKCVCCEAPKPGSKPVPTAQVKEVPKFSFGIENGLINGQGFIFGIPADKNVAPATKEDKKPDLPTAEKPPAASAPNTQFMFGIKSPNGAKPALPTTTPTPTITLESKKPNEPVKISFGVPPAKRPAASINDGTDAPQTPKKADTTFKPSIVNGSLSKTDVAKPEPAKFTFGAVNNKLEETNKNVFGTPKITEAAASITTPAPTFKFNEPTPVAQKTPSPAFKFNAEVKTTSTAAAPPPTTFGAGSNATNGATPAFGFPVAKSTTKAEEPFKFSVSTAAKPSFGTAKPAATSGMFGSSAASSNVFGSALNQSSPAQTTPAPAFGGSGPVFGNGGLTGAAPVTFGGGKAPAPTFGAPAAAPPPAYGASAAAPPPAYGASAAAPPPAYGATSTPAFGKPATNGVFNFGSTSNQNTESSQPSKSFNFGGSAATSTPAAFTFGAPSNSQSTSGPAFSFGGPSFNTTDTKSTFNAEAKQPPPGRVIRRALRRTQR